MYLERQLTKDFAPGIRQRGYGLFTSRMVSLLTGDQWEVSARVGGSNVQRVQMSRQDDELYVFCDCPYFETESACKHIWATILAADQKTYLRGAGGSGTLELVEDFEPEGFGEEFDEDQESFPWTSRGTRRAAVPAPPKPPKIPAWQRLLQEMNNETVAVAPAARRVDR
jgi:hypothetical protein